MFGALFVKECRQILKSLVFYIFVLIFIMTMTSQMGDSESIEPPKPGQEYYGYAYSDDPKVIMKTTLAKLFRETYRGSFNTYPFGFYKGVSLSEAEIQALVKDIEEWSGKNWDTLVQEYLDHYTGTEDTDYESIIKKQITYVIEPKEGFTYEQFEEFMEKVSSIVGKGSSYEKENYEGSAMVLKTYDQALKEYGELCHKDRVTRAVIRLFCDYAGIVLALLPIFLGVSRCLRDRRAKVMDVVYSKNVSSTRIIVSRYLANVLLIYLTVLITAFLMQMPYQYAAKQEGIRADGFAFLTGTAVWLLPEILAVLALSFLITESTGNIAGIFVQAVWAYGSLFGANTLTGNFGLKLVARWNRFGGYSEFAKEAGDLLFNRCYYVLFAFVCIALTVLVYGKKRREGETLYGKIFKARR